MELDDLPDDALVQVLSHLPPRQLLTSARAVSRRWRRLCAERDAWTRCRVRISFPEDYPVAAEVLRRAPCLHSLSVHFMSLPLPLVDLASGTACAVRRLKLVTWGPDSLQQASRILRNQRPKQHLEALSLYLNDFDPRWFEEVMESVDEEAALSSLRLVYVQGSLKSPVLEAPAALCPRRRRKGRLRHLKIRAVSEGFASRMLELNAESLQSADLACSVGRQLSTRLRDCRRLTSLTLHAWWTFDSSSDTAEVGAYLRGALRLRALNIKYEIDHKFFEENCSEDPLLLDLLAALASTGKSDLETLGLSYATIESKTYASQLAATLSGLPRLATLRLNLTRVDMLVDDLLANNLPSLRVVQCVAPFSCCDASVNDCRVPTFRRLVRGNPRIHVVGIVLEHFVEDCVNINEPLRRCACCWEHPVNRRKGDTRSFALFGHSPEQDCSVCRGYSASHMMVMLCD